MDEETKLMLLKLDFLRSVEQMRNPFGPSFTWLVIVSEIVAAGLLYVILRGIYG
jgi:hypothetical protein